MFTTYKNKNKSCFTFHNNFRLRATNCQTGNTSLKLFVFFLSCHLTYTLIFSTYFGHFLRNSVLVFVLYVVICNRSKQVQSYPTGQSFACVRYETGSGTGRTSQIDSVTQWVLPTIPQVQRPGYTMILKTLRTRSEPFG